VESGVRRGPVRVPAAPRALKPIGSSMVGHASSTSRTKTPKTWSGLSFASLMNPMVSPFDVFRKGKTHSAYNSRSCSPVSPISINRDSGNASRTLRTPARLRAAGADKRPLNNDRPAYDFNFIEPRCNREQSSCRRGENTPHQVEFVKLGRTR
jgi:hypothetical protein